jgi:hypothetical protein
MGYELVKDSPELIRDTSNQAILNRDIKGLKEYRQKKNMRLSQNNEIVQCQDDINTLKNEIKDIKKMFGQILGAINSKEK